MGSRVDVELETGEHLSLRFPGAHTSGSGTCDCETFTAQLRDPRRKLLQERMFRHIEELLGCLFQAPEAEAAPDDPLPDEAEYLGSYPSIPGYLRAMLEPEVTRACSWILDHLDYRAVQRRWESDGCHLLFERGHVYRLATPGSDGEPSGR